MPRTALCISTVVASSLAFTSLALADTYTVSVGLGWFNPDNVNCEPGDVIRWERAGGNHTVTSGSSCTANGVYFDAPINSSNTSFEWTVPATVTGVIPYFCDPHCSSGMTGSLTVSSPAEDSGFRVRLIDVVAYGVNYSGSSSAESLNMTFQESGHMMIGLEVESDTATLTLDVDSIDHAGTVQIRTIGGAFDSTFPYGTYNLVLPVGAHAIIMTSPPDAVSLSWNNEMDGGGDAYVSMDALSGTGGIGLDYRQTHDIGWLWLTTAPGASAGIGLTAIGGDAEQTVSWIGAVTGDGTFTMPDEASDSTATMFTEGDHTITLGSASTLGIQMEDGDDDGGGGGGCLGDLNGDSAVDGADLTILLGAWGCTP